MEQTEREWREVLATGEPIRRVVDFDTPSGPRSFEYAMFPIREHDGYWLLERIRRWQPDVRIAAITALGFTRRSDKRRWFRRIHTQPVDPARLAALLQQGMEN